MLIICDMICIQRCQEIKKWVPIDQATLRSENPGGFYDGPVARTSRKVALSKFPLLDDEGNEIPVYNSQGVRVSRREVEVDDDEPPCGVLMNLSDIQGMFNPNDSPTVQDSHDNEDFQSESSSSSSEHEHKDDHWVRVEAYPLAFLKSVGNVKATGVPHCFYPLLTSINKSVRRNHNSGPTLDDAAAENTDDHPGGHGDPSHPLSTYQAVKPVSSQFYNYLSHRVASRAGRHDSQQGSVTGAISGAFASSAKDKAIAREKQNFCQVKLPSERFHGRITSVDDCPTSCRAELVYSIDVRALSDQSGSCASFVSTPFF